MKVIYDIVKGPRLTEKTDLLKELYGKVVFKVNPRANKVEIRQAVEKLFNVKVANVRTTMVRGKKRRVGIKSQGRSSNWKKAYVTLKEGDISFIDEL